MISVIVPVYNVKEYLERCVKSILEQSYKDIELILVDDGSTDGSSELCDEFARQYECITCIHQANGRAPKARNTGIDAAKGEYLLFIDSDDYIEPDMCEHMLAEMQDEKVTFVQCGMIITESDGSQTYRIPDAKMRISSAEAMEGFFNKTGKITASFSDKLIRRRVFDGGLRMDETIGNEDTEVIPRLIDASDDIVIMDKAYYYYVKRENSNSSYNRFSLKIYEFIPSLYKFRDMCREKYPTAYDWFDYYMANTINGMYLYLLACDDNRKYANIKCKLRLDLFKWTRKCNRNVRIKNEKKGTLKEYLLRALLGDSLLSFLIRVRTK